MAGSIRQTFPLGTQWPTVDPFLFCVHHVDAYPAGNADFGPAASLEGRTLGSDFEGIDGWRMYHGEVVPGFPQHPHRGFETVTYVRQGLVDHADSLGAAARYGRGDVQWLTAGRGIVHAEMFPLLDRDAPNPIELFQIWVNLAGAGKMADPFFAMQWDADIPRYIVPGDGASVEITVIAGALGDARPPTPPPSSWASRPDADLAIWHARLEGGASWMMPAAATADSVRILYFFGGDDLVVDGQLLAPMTGVLLDSVAVVEISSRAGAECLVLQGRPIGEPVAQYGPFVTNDRAGVEQAFEDYRRTGFGGWPWPADGPVHGVDGARFARHPDGSIERPLVEVRASQ
ncbi:MAG: pirin family protein [Ilumatobacteraceae bacterium]|nr:pirin family protein [Ilumatobacteraceae bacterium]